MAICSLCEVPSDFDITEDYVGVAVAWECPWCGTKNWTEGDLPHIIALAQAAMTDSDAVAVFDGDTGASRDIQG